MAESVAYIHILLRVLSGCLKSFSGALYPHTFLMGILEAVIISVTCRKQQSGIDHLIHAWILDAIDIMFDF